MHKIEFWQRFKIKIRSSWIKYFYRFSVYCNGINYKKTFNVNTISLTFL